MVVPRKQTKWIQNANPKPGALHKQLGYPYHRDIPSGLLTDISKAKIGTHVRGHTVTKLLKRRAMFAINANAWR